MTALIVIEAIVIVGLVVLVAGLLRSHAEILRRLHALDAGEDPSPVHMGATRVSAGVGSRRNALPAEIVGTTPEGRSVSIALSASRGHTLLAFLSSGCGTCAAVWAALRDPGSDLPVDRVVAVTKSAEDESISAVRELAPPTVTTVMSTDAWREFEVPYTPYFALVDAASGHLIGDGAAGSWEQIVSLVGRSVGDSRDGGRTTRERLEDSAEELRRAGIRPGDPALYRQPGDPR